MDSYVERQMDNRMSFEFANLGGLESPKGTVSGSFFYHQTTSPGVLDIARNDFEFSQIFVKFCVFAIELMSSPPGSQFPLVYIYEFIFFMAGAN